MDLGSGAETTCVCFPRERTYMLCGAPLGAWAGGIPIKIGMAQVPFPSLRAIKSMEARDRRVVRGFPMPSWSFPLVGPLQIPSNISTSVTAASAMRMILAFLSKITNNAIWALYVKVAGVTMDWRLLLCKENDPSDEGTRACPLPDPPTRRQLASDCDLDTSWTDWCTKVKFRAWMGV